MASVHVQAPVSHEEIMHNAREYALLATINPYDMGQMSSKKLIEFANRYGNDNTKSKLPDRAAGLQQQRAMKLVVAAGDINFRKFAEAFHKVGQKVEGDGNCIGWAARDESGIMSPYKFHRRVCKPDDVAVKITYSGMCHSDVHQLRGEWGNSKYPMVPGHEFLGVVIDTGKDVKGFKAGDFVGIGNLVDSCRECDSCKKGQEQFCPGVVLTYNSKDEDGETTQGGYSTHVVVKEHFVLHLPKSLHVPGGAPLLCAGITSYSPLRFYNVDQPGLKVGVAGLGGVGHMAVQFAKKFGQHVTVISRSDKKKHDALNVLKADDYLATNDEEAVKKATAQFDVIVDAISAHHDINQYLSLLKTDGKLIVLGLPTKPLMLQASGLLFGRKTIGGSIVGGIKETQEMLDFCAKHDIKSMVEVVDVDEVNKSIDRMVEGDVKYRFVIDIQKSLIMDQ